MPGIGIAHYAIYLCHYAMCCTDVVHYAIWIRACYAMSGTDVHINIASAHTFNPTNAMIIQNKDVFRSTPLSAYARAMQCRVLTPLFAHALSAYARDTAVCPRESYVRSRV
eukprot:3914301-Rhodomonas_salina.2